MKFKTWFLRKPKADRIKFAKLAGTTFGYLEQLAHGKRNASAELAAKMETAASKVGDPLKRGDICATCSRCPYYKAASEFRGLV